LVIAFADNPTFRGFFAPTRFEADVIDCEVEGSIPRDLDGTFYRVGGDWMYPPKHPDDSPFAADGYASMFRFGGGSVDFRGRYIRTPRYLANAAAKRQLFGYYRNPFTDDPAVHGVSGTVANTNIVAHAGRLFALKEDARPYELDPDTLETRGAFDFGGAYASPTFTAHPKVDAATGEMVTYGYEADGLASNAIWIYTIDRAGMVTSERRIRAPYLSMVHDIAISEKHILIPIVPMTSSMERLQAGKVHWGWDATLPSYIGVLPRDGDAADVRWFKGPERAIVHTFAAMDRGNRLVMHAPVSDGNPFPFFPAVDGSPFDPVKARTVVRSYTFDLNSSDDGWAEEAMFVDAPGALSRIDDRYMGHDYRYGLMGFADATKPFDDGSSGAMRGRVTNSIGRYDFATGRLESFFAGSSHALQEVCFVPRSPTAPEADGWVMAVASDFAEMKSELVIADTAALADGPVARVKLPFRLSSQIHGNWVPRAALGTA
jgi:carotenoid cleavage dioxygenase-like enzyme